MGRKTLIAVCALVLLMAGAAIGAYRYDDSRSDEIAKGVSVGAIELGGMTEAEARAALEQRLVAPLAKPIRAIFHDHTYVLGTDALDINADIDAIVDRALEVSREGDLPSRLVRYATGEDVDENITPE